MNEGTTEGDTLLHTAREFIGMPRVEVPQAY